ncbi:hypothetical protein M3E13_04645 [Oceanobacillus kimchii]|uniref:hypothetical protein n=1 Tax=Oceanobacillus kimchii TaxID=746691 RepID=UPI0021A798B7|nr:hypothetical protein [Oceanobacillus kimchii]MCT1577131.1 hypothetical protein [Oceanobacillus kimchii]MCT2135201.1 hypothetical protein [Oceanobacillus kimchii]
MYEHVDEALLSNIIDELPKRERNMYQAFIEIEDILIQEAETYEQLLNMVSTYSPHKRIAKKLGLTLEDLLEQLSDIDEKVTRKLEKRKIFLYWKSEL